MASLQPLPVLHKSRNRQEMGKLLVKLSKKLIILVICISYTLICFRSPGNSKQDYSVRTAFESSVIEKKKIIVVVDGLWQYEFGMEKYSFIDAGCPVSNCYLTRNTSYIENEQYDAIITQPTSRDKPMNISRRKPEHVYILFCNEPPLHVPQLYDFEDYFNYTMSYYSDSDFPIPYGRIEPLVSAPKSASEIELKLREAARTTNPAVGKTKLALWMVSNCDAWSKRQDYVRLLQKYIPVDIYSTEGRCGGTDECNRVHNDHHCYDKLEVEYKFYLAFENTICREYVSEKFFNVISRNVVPVVLGGANYSAIAPPHSYIDALEFTPKELAEYLLKLDRNDSLYAEYFWWKPHYRVLDNKQVQRKAFCDLCATLHQVPYKKKTSKGLHEWYHERGHCIHRPIFPDE